MSTQPIMPGVCADTQGMLPACAPLAVPYVPFQQAGAKQYPSRQALDNGTLFPGLNLPFKAKSEATNLPATPLGELQALEFVILELGLYLDTHGDDAEAFELYKKYVMLEREARRKYVAANGPLFQTEAADGKSWNWYKDPWPWNLAEGGAK